MLREASEPSTVSTVRTSGVSNGEIAARSSSVRSHSSIPRFSHSWTHAPASSCATRNGTFCRTSHSAMSVASEKPCGASSSRRSVLKRSVRIIPVNAGSSTSRVSMESKTGSLSSCRSRLYASGCAFSVASRPLRLPINRPALPRASSAMSGFFFCGMMLDPVENASSSSTKPNSFVAQMITSSACRDRSTPICAVTKANSATKSRDAVPSIEFAEELVKPSSVATNCGSSPSELPARAPDPYGESAATRASQSASRSRSRISGQAWASR